MSTNTFLPFREHHLLAILEQYQNSQAPLDILLARYFRHNRSLGAKDKKFLSESIYTLVRWRGLIDHHLKEPTWPTRWYFYKEHSIEDLLCNDLPLSSRCSAPSFLVDQVTQQFGEDKTIDFFHTSNQRAPLTIRANPAKTTRDELCTKLSAKVELSKTPLSPHGIRIHSAVNLFQLEEFQKGLFEVQDEASQLAADHVAPTPGDKILDFCAGSGGKSLAFAHKTEGKGQIYLHDIRPKALLEAKKRLRRAGIQNYQILPEEAFQKRTWKGSMDWVFVDAPCSGTGTLRRNPDLKWRLSPQDIESLIATQRQIFERAWRFVKPGGHICYCTCSILEQENEKQLEHFLKHFAAELVSPPFQSLPTPGNMDGFYLCHLQRAS